MQEDLIRKGRLGGDRPPELAAFLSSMEADRWIAEADIRVDMAHLLMLHRQSIIDDTVARTLMSALFELYEEGLPDEVFDDRYEDIHAGIEAYLIRKTGSEVGGRLHMGRSRNDEVATCIRIRLRHEILHIMREILRLRDILLATAGEHTETIVPGFTHMQHAQPTTLAHYLLAYEQAFARDFERFSGAFRRVDASPLGAAAFASTGYPIDRDVTRELLGFEALSLNTMDAVSARDFALEVMSTCALFMTTVSRLCEEQVLWSTSFVDFVRLNDIYCSTSSVMPQKKNPDTAEIMRAKTGRVAGTFVAGLMCIKALPMSYNRDLQDLTPHLWEAVSETGRCASLLAGMMETAEFNTGRMAEEAGKGFSTATELADVLVREYGIPFRSAHGIVGRAVRKGSLDLGTLDEAAEEMAGFSLTERGLTQERIDEALDPFFGILVRNVPGGPAPVQTSTAVHDRRTQLRDDMMWLESTHKRLAHAEESLISASRELVQ